MAVVSTVSNHFKYQVMAGEIDFSSDEFRTILMQDSFAFDEDTHATYLAVSGEEIPTGGGYTARGIELLSGELTENDTNDKGKMVWGSNPTWTAAGGSIGPAGAAVIFDETSSDDTVVGCIDFGEDHTATEGLTIQIRSGEVTLA
jgi:hypothetical protein